MSKLKNLLFRVLQIYFPIIIIIIIIIIINIKNNINDTIHVQ